LVPTGEAGGWGLALALPLVYTYSLSPGEVNCQKSDPKCTGKCFNPAYSFW
jgi:hypothetical protein